ncbi:MAG: HAD-IIIA family hydrolase [Planctomycetota bacterium]
MRPAVFLDRDDTLIRNADLDWSLMPGVTRGDLARPDLVDLLPGAYDACRDLRHAGFTLIIVTNQGGVARGHYGLPQVDATNIRLEQMLNDHGSPLISACYSCPYHPNGAVPGFTKEHPWRKPNPGMILAAAEDHDLDLSVSWIIGDKQRDLDAGINAGLAPERCLLVADGAYPSLFEASRTILGTLGG